MSDPDAVVTAQISEWLALLKARNYRPGSIRSFRRGLAAFVSFLIAENIAGFRDVTAATLSAYRRHLVDAGYSGHTICFYLRAVRKFFVHLEETGQIFMNPAAGPIIPRPARRS